MGLPSAPVRKRPAPQVPLNRRGPGATYAAPKTPIALLSTTQVLMLHRAGDVVVETWGGSEERRLCLPVRSRTLSNMTEAVYRNLGVGGGAR